MSETVFYWTLKAILIAATALFTKHMFSFFGEQEQENENDRRTIMHIGALAILLLFTFILLPAARKAVSGRITEGTVSEKSVNMNGACVVTVETKILFLKAKKDFFVLPADFNSASQGSIFDTKRLPYKAD